MSAVFPESLFWMMGASGLSTSPSPTQGVTPAWQQTTLGRQAARAVWLWKVIAVFIAYDWYSILASKSVRSSPARAAPFPSDASWIWGD